MVESGVKALVLKKAKTRGGTRCNKGYNLTRRWWGMHRIKKVRWKKNRWEAVSQNSEGCVVRSRVKILDPIARKVYTNYSKQWGWYPERCRPVGQKERNPKSGRCGSLDQKRGSGSRNVWVS